MTDIALDRQRRLLAILACPSCHARLEIDAPTTVREAVVDGDMTCARCGTVGVIRSYRVSFLESDLGDAWTPRGLAESAVDLGGAAVEFSGDWTDLPFGKLGLEVGARVTGRTRAAGVAVELATHTWGGAADVALGGERQRVQLYADGLGFERAVVTRPDPTSTSGEQTWSITVAKSDRDDVPGCQGIVKAVAELVPARDAPPPRWRPFNQGNPYPARFDELLTTVPADGVILDIGGGDRRHTDPRVLNFEYLKFAGPDFFGDGLRLPIADDSVDLILSQAVLEHVPEPQRAVDELRRVLRPGGRIYAEFAFMQPLHAVPFHFFNITPHGADLLFTDWTILESGTFGGLETTLEWMFRLVDARGKIGPEAAQSVLDSLRQLDGKLSRQELDHIASAVFVEAIK